MLNNVEFAQSSKVVKVIYTCTDYIKTDLKQHTRNKRTEPVNWYLDHITFHRTKYLPKVKLDTM